MFRSRILLPPYAAALFLAILVGVLPAQEKSTEGYKDLDALLVSLPETSVKLLNSQSALLFSALPLACEDDLQAKPTARAYFWQPTYKTVDGYDKSRSFYGCNDWQSAVSATWTLVTLLKRYPELASGQMVREKLTDHLGRQNLEGELTYFKAAGNFQRPYGYAWYLKLFAELATWKDPDGSRYAENATPLARYFADSMVAYLIDVEKPNRTASQANTALTLNLLLDYVDVTRDMTIKRAASETARRLYTTDTNCETDKEAATPEMMSPCLTEAAVMSRVLDQGGFVTWLNAFLPAANSAQFKSLRTISFESTGTRGRASNRGPRETSANAPSGPANNDVARRGRGGPALNPRATWIGLAFNRAEAYSHLASALPQADTRVAVFKRLAAIHAGMGQDELTNPAAFDAPWVGAFAVSYLTSIGQTQ